MKILKELRGMLITYDIYFDALSYELLYRTSLATFNAYMMKAEEYYFTPCLTEFYCVGYIGIFI
jgi:hypothetical protein